MLAQRHNAHNINILPPPAKKPNQLLKIAGCENLMRFAVLRFSQ